jgi:hypothetical protein
MTIDPSFASIVAAVAATITAIVGFISFWYYRKEHRLNGLIQAFKVLNDSKHREARYRVYSAFASYNKNKNLDVFVDEHQKEFTEIVRADFDQMGALVKNKAIQKQGFLQAYGETSYKCWNALRDHIQRERKLRNFENYMESFEWAF